VTEKMTSTEVARRFGDVLAEVKHGGRSVLVTKNGEAVAELRPIGGGAPDCTLEEFVQAWEELALSSDDAFAEDLASVNASDQPASNPWD
jgi:prevent-host-death family protein